MMFWELFTYNNEKATAATYAFESYSRFHLDSRVTCVCIMTYKMFSNLQLVIDVCVLASLFCKYQVNFLFILFTYTTIEESVVFNL